MSCAAVPKGPKLGWVKQPYRSRLLAGALLGTLTVTVIEPRLTDVTLITHWLACFVLAALAAATTLVDASRVRSEQPAEPPALIESTLHEIQREKRSRQDAAD